MNRTLPENQLVEARPAFGIVAKAKNMTREGRAGNALKVLADDLEIAAAVCRDIGRVEAATSLTRAARKLAIMASLSANCPEIAPK